jgi:hypothetical protein
VYFVDRSGITGDFVSEAEARALFERYRGTAGFEGDLACGFTYRPQPIELALVPAVTLRGPAVRVHLVPDAEVPADVRERLEREAAAETRARAS